METMTDIETLDIELTSVGRIALGVEGCNEYVTLRTKDRSDLDPETAREWLLQRYYADSSEPGGYYCHTVYAIQEPDSTTVCLGKICHRYDV